MIILIENCSLVRYLSYKFYFLVFTDIKKNRTIALS